MRLSLLRMGQGVGQHFGEYQKNFGFYRITIAANEQQVWKGFAMGVWKPVKKHLRDWWMFAIPGTIYYLAWDWGKKEHERWRRAEAKKPGLAAAAAKAKEEKEQNEKEE